MKSTPAEAETKKHVICPTQTRTGEELVAPVTFKRMSKSEAKNSKTG